MANQEHLAILKQGVEVWNKWRQEHPEVKPDLSEADLSNIALTGFITRKFTFGYHPNFYSASIIGVDLTGANLARANLSKAEMAGADLKGANFTEAVLIDAILINADLSGATFNKAKLTRANLNSTALVGTDLSEADLSEVGLFKSELTLSNLQNANLSKALLFNADLSDANLTRAILTGADLTGVNFVRTILTEANLTDCRVYSISVWDIQLEDTKQQNLVITPEGQPNITVDNLEVAQFIYLLLNNQKIREVIDTITSKAVLILGRFTPERKTILDALRDALRTRGYLPILFDFEKPASRDITETVSTLAHLARFVIADLTDAKSIPQELQAIVPNLPSVPVQPLILNSQHEYGMFEHFSRFPWVLPVYRYKDENSLLQSVEEKVILPAEEKARELNKG